MSSEDEIARGMPVARITDLRIMDIGCAKLQIRVLLLLAVFLPAVAVCEERQQGCYTQMSTLRLSGGEASAFYSKWYEEVRVRCAESNKKGSGISKMRAISRCIKSGVDSGS